MDDKHQSRENEIFREEMAKQKEAQDERDFLKDKSIGGPNAPRPTDAYIDQSLGNSMSRMEQAQEAGKQADKRMNREETQADQQEKLDRSLRAHEKNRIQKKGRSPTGRSMNSSRNGRDDFER